MLTCQNAIYHDIHHQSWGIKVRFFSAWLVNFTSADAILCAQTNYSQLYTTFWDRALGTMWAGEAEALEKRYRGVTDVDVGGKWVEWFGKNKGSGQKWGNEKAKLS